MIVYIEGCEDALNLDHVAFIEFRDKDGRIPPRRGPLLGEKVTNREDIYQAKVFLNTYHCLQAPDMTYYETSARQLWDFVRRLQEATDKWMSPPVMVAHE